MSSSLDYLPGLAGADEVDLTRPIILGPYHVSRRSTPRCPDQGHKKRENCHSRFLHLNTPLLFPSLRCLTGRSRGYAIYRRESK